ncbi:AbiV family abortive infection protein [Mucilaginibacter gracilis]|uniref:AbiV family abortive infection protein n=1 Tax=Mucilaginibacter gracilis TaxID=423350 RepID=A0A495ITI8_9SPHI|nr:AbiV family abortive infection protein [Mucilaginibacter gracilis]RKR80077.1 AbiV family abortive infection protein [Mucilaginibacter gracilis]
MPVSKSVSKFRSLSKQQCLDVYPSIRLNAAKHFHAAKLLAANLDFGNGIAHLILGTEEQVKAAVLMLQAYDFPVRDIKNYDKLFYLHAARHNVLKEFHSIFVFADSVMKYRAVRQRTKGGDNFAKMFMDGLLAVKDGLENYQWWDSADKLKQNCFYLDYTDEGMIDPARIGVLQWETTFKFITKVTHDLQELTETIVGASGKELAEFRQQFIDGEIGDLMAESIVRKRV